MPNFDGTGPQGLGAQIGRKMGPCNTQSTQETTNKCFRRCKKRNAEQGFNCRFSILLEKIELLEKELADIKSTIK